MTELVAMVVRGDFTLQEFAELVRAIRTIDARRPDAYFEITAVDANKTTLETAERMLRDAVPEMPGRTTKWSHMPRQENPESERYLVWSVEHNLWWRANGHGYTQKVVEARRFSRADALKVCTEAIPGNAARHGFLFELPVREADIENMRLVYHQDFAGRPREDWE